MTHIRATVTVTAPPLRLLFYQLNYFLELSSTSIDGRDTARIHQLLTVESSLGEQYNKENVWMFILVCYTVAIVTKWSYRDYSLCCFTKLHISKGKMGQTQAAVCRLDIHARIQNGAAGLSNFKIGYPLNETCKWKM